MSTNVPPIGYRTLSSGILLGEWALDATWVVGGIFHYHNFEEYHPRWVQCYSYNGEENHWFCAHCKKDVPEGLLMVYKLMKA